MCSYIQRPYAQCHYTLGFCHSGVLNPKVLRLAVLRLMVLYPGVFTAISRKVVGKSALDYLERYNCGWLLVHCSSKKFERMTGEAVDVCLRVLKESNKSRFYSYSVRNSLLIISHITFRDCRLHIFPTTFLEIAVYAQGSYVKCS